MHTYLGGHDSAYHNKFGKKKRKENPKEDLERSGLCDVLIFKQFLLGRANLGQIRLGMMVRQQG